MPAGRSRRTDSACQIETMEGASQEQQRQSDENWAIRFKRCQSADPSSAYARASNTSGPTQQTDAPIAASIPPTRNPFPLREDCFGSDISSETDLRLRTIA